MENLFLTDNPSDKENYARIMEYTNKAILESFSNDIAYTGPEPFELKSIIAMDSILPEKGLGFEKTMDLVKEKILPNMLRPTSTCYMPHLHSPALIESLSAEAIISAFNQSMDSWDQAPAATETEVEVVKHLCRLYGYSDSADGTFTSGGSQSNQTAIILARDWFCNNILNYDVKKYGLPENFRKLRMYTSEISHFSMEKSAHILGMGYESVVKVPVNEKKQMDIQILNRLIKEDVKKGNIPFLVVATIGTTDFGSIDCIEEIRKLCDEHKMWLHADAAYGSGVIMSKKYKSRIGNLSLCDSITVDFHKMFMLNISASAVLVKNGKNFDALTIHADYLNREEDEEDGYTNLVDKSLQTTRRFDALKVWMSFLMRGQDGWSELIEKSMDNAAFFYSSIKKVTKFKVVTEPEISSVVFRYADPSKTNEENDEINKKVRRILMHSHGIIIGQTVSDGRVCLKFTLLNPLLTEEKLEQLIALILKIANSMTSV